MHTKQPWLPVQITSKWENGAWERKKKLQFSIWYQLANRFRRSAFFHLKTKNKFSLLFICHSVVVFYGFSRYMKYSRHSQIFVISFSVLLSVFCCCCLAHYTNHIDLKIPWQMNLKYLARTVFELDTIDTACKRQSWREERRQSESP